MVAFADDAGLIITEKDLEEIRRILGDCYEEVQRWMESIRLELADTKPKLCCLPVGRKWKPSPSTWAMHHHFSAKY